MSPAHRRNSLLTVEELYARHNQQAHEHGRPTVPRSKGEPGRHRKPTREKWRGTESGFLPVLVAAVALLVVSGCTVVGEPVAAPEVSTEAPNPTRPPAPQVPSDVEVFEMVAEAALWDLIDDETCSVMRTVGYDPFIAAFRDGFTESGRQEWRSEYDAVLVEIIDDACGSGW